MRTKETESDIQFTICEYLALRGHFFWRQNSYGIYDTVRGIHRSLPRFSMRGLPDIILVRQGVFWGLEVKTSRGRQSPDQKLCQEKLTAAGAEYHLVRSLDDVVALGL